MSDESFNLSDFSKFFEEAFKAQVIGFTVDAVSQNHPIYSLGSYNPVSSFDASPIVTLHVQCLVDWTNITSGSIMGHFMIPGHFLVEAGIHNYEVTNRIELRYKTNDINALLRDLKNLPYKRFSENVDDQLSEVLEKENE